MLELSRLDMRQSPFRPEQLDPSALIKELLDKFRPSIERKELHISADLSHDPPFHADKEALRLALMNVLENAVKFSPEKGEISVQMAWKPDTLEIRILNTADVLSHEDLSRIFNPFQRLKGSNIPGSGLGLAISKKLLKGITALSRL